MGSQHLLDLPGRQPMSGDIDDVVGAGHHVDVPVGVDEPGVAGLIETGEGSHIGPHEVVVGLPEGLQGAGRQRQFDRQRTDFARRELSHIRRFRIEHADIPAGYGPRRRAVLDRKPPDTEAIRGDRPASLGLPPMVDDRDTEMLLGPGDGRRVGPLAGEEQRPEVPQIAVADQLTVGVFALDRAEGGRRGEEHPHMMLLDDAPEGAGIGRADRLSFVHDGRATQEQRRIDDV